MPHARASVWGRAAQALRWGVALVAASACTDASMAPVGEVTLRTDAPAYVALQDASPSFPTRYSLAMGVAITNNTGGPIALQACEESGGTPRFAVSMAAIPNDWGSAYENAWSCAQPYTLVLEVGQSRVDRIELVAPRTFDALTGEALGILEGQMRVVYFVEGRALASNAFEIRTDRSTR